MNKATTLLAILAVVAVFSAWLLPMGVSACDGIEVSISISGENCIEDDGEGSVIFHYLSLVLNFLSAGIGLVVTMMIIVGGVRYVLAGDSPEAMQKAKSTILNAVIALVLFIFTYAILNFLIPGGLIGG